VRELNGFRNTAQIIVHDHDVGGFHGGIRSSSPHCYADIGARQGRRIVDPVTGHRRGAKFFLQGFDGLELVVRQ
jgi:hypothetical protein